MKKKLPIKKSPQTTSSPPKPAAVGVMKNPFSVTKTSVYPGGFIMLYGPPGEGKTTVAAHAPKPLFTHTSDEQGIKFALSKKVVPADLSEWLVELDPLFPTG